MPWLPGPGATGDEDVYVGDGTNETVDGLGGNDILDGRGGADSLFGNDGDDTLRPGDDYVTDIIDGGNGYDILDYSPLFEDGMVIANVFGRQHLSGLFDTVTNVEEYVGTEAGDRLMGVSGVQIIRGGGGNDYLGVSDAVNMIAFGGAGRDFFELSGTYEIQDFDVGADFIHDATNTIDSITIDGADTILHSTGATIRIFGINNLTLEQWQSHVTAGTRLNSGPTGAQTYNGTAHADWIWSADGADTISGLDGDDTLLAGSGNDAANGGAGADTIEGGSGNDTVNGGAGGDLLFGNSGTDVLSYAGSSAAVTINLLAGTASGGDAAGDVFSSFESITGSSHNDVLTGNQLANTLRGEVGADTLHGGAGNDALLGGDGDDVLVGGAGADDFGGGAGIDTVDYSTSSARVVVRLDTGLGGSGDATGDTYASIERVIGSAFGDELEGRDYAVDVLIGGGGNDIIEGGIGADTLDGGDGSDTLYYALSPNGVDVRLFNGFAAGGDANGDVFTNFENIIGSGHADVLSGNELANRLDGWTGNDTLVGREGNDVLNAYQGTDTLLGGEGDDMLLSGNTNQAEVFGGGVGNDLVMYASAVSAVTVNLATGLGSGGAAGDSYFSVEDIFGSWFDDVIIAKANYWDNVFDGYRGNDTMTGGNGNDTFVFGFNEGSDTVTDYSVSAANNNDTIRMKGWGSNFDTFEEVIATGSQFGADTVFNFGNGQTLTLQNVTLGNLTAADFLFVSA